MAILVVEDSRFTAQVLKKRIENELEFEVLTATTLSDTRALLESGQHNFTISLVDLRLPDATDGESLDYVISAGVPAIAFTASYNDNIRDVVWSKGVVDYVVKEGTQNIDYVVSLIRRFHRNKFIKVLVVEDSSIYRITVRKLLEAHGYQIFEATNGTEAFEVIRQQDDIKLIILDYNMTGQNGLELSNKIRQRYSRTDLAIIGMSAYGSSCLATRFIKNGANDFIYKPFTAEEFYCRVTQNVEMLEYVNDLKELTMRDPLTHLHNRRFFFEAGEKLYAGAKRKNLIIAVAMIDVDNFKSINDKYGHESGDQVLKIIGKTLQNSLRSSDIVARIGGEEFAVLTVGMNPRAATQVFERIRYKVDQICPELDGEGVKVTISIGVCPNDLGSLDGMVNRADKLLYEAKNAGRNRVIVE